MTVPFAAQTQLIRSALEKAAIDPASIGYIEAHGTGTKLGDSMEVLSLSQVFKAEKGSTLPIGSVKSNIDHLEAASGMAGLSKIIMQMKQQKLVASLHAETISDYIDFKDTPLYVHRELSDWQRMRDEHGRDAVKGVFKCLWCRGQQCPCGD